MPSLSVPQQRNLDRARRRATHSVTSLTGVAAQFDRAADIAPSEALQTVLNAVAVLIAESAEDHRIIGHCVACRPGEDCPMVGVADAFQVDESRAA